jgi:GTPase SAR1 family protein
MIDALDLQTKRAGTGSNGRHHHPPILRAGIAQTREELMGVLSCIENDPILQGEQVARRGISLLRQKVAQNRFYLTVVGQFKRGKTSFLNALLGAEVLPVAILPLTSVVTILRYGDRPCAEVVFQSGTRSAIELGDLADYVTENGNPKNVRAVGHVEVAYPSEYLRGGVALVDTPGIGSVYAHNTQVTYSFLPQVDAAIFVTSPEPPISKAETEFLSDLAAHVRKVFVVLNKTDLLSDGQLREMVDFTRQSLPASMAASPDSFFTVSSTRALQARQHGDTAQLAASGFATLEEKLGEFLVSEKNVVFYDSVARNARKLIADLRLSIELQIRAAKMPLEELRTKLAELDQHLRHAEQEREDSQVLLQSGVARLCGLVEAEASRFAEVMVEPLRVSIRERMKTLGALSRKQQASEMDKFLRVRIEGLLEGWRIQFEGQAAEHFRQATIRFAGHVNELIADVRRTVGSLFGFSVQSFDATEELAELEPCGYFTDPVLDWGLGNAPLMLPAGLFRHYLLRVMLQKAESELKRNTTRVAFDYKKRLNKSLALFLEGMTSKLNETIEGLRRAVESALARHREDSATAEIQLQKQETILAKLDECDERVARILAQYEGDEGQANLGGDPGRDEASAVGPCTIVGGSQDV